MKAIINKIEIVLKKLNLYSILGFNITFSIANLSVLILILLTLEFIDVSTKNSSSDTLSV
jgi:hypothetical protein